MNLTDKQVHEKMLEAKKEVEEKDKDLIGFKVAILKDGEIYHAIEQVTDDIYYTRGFSQKDNNAPKLIIKAIDDFRERTLELFKVCMETPYQLESSSKEM